MFTQKNFFYAVFLWLPYNWSPNNWSPTTDPLQLIHMWYMIENWSLIEHKLTLNIARNYNVMRVTFSVCRVFLIWEKSLGFFLSAAAAAEMVTFRHFRTHKHKGKFLMDLKKIPLISSLIIISFFERSAPGGPIWRSELIKILRLTCLGILWQNCHKKW